jgi:hypothetical protein
VTAVEAAQNLLAKWRNIFASWQLGTRLNNDPEYLAVRDHREITILMRAELSAMLRMLVLKGVFTVEEYNDMVAAESLALSRLYEKRFPGATAHEDGIHLEVELSNAWMSKFPP